MKLKEIATEINGYLKKFEADPAINRRKTGNVNIPPYFRACSWHSGRYVGVRYVSFQGTTYLSRQSAEQFLAWLRQGGIGTHYKAGVDA